MPPSTPCIRLQGEIPIQLRNFVANRGRIERSAEGREKSKVVVLKVRTLANSDDEHVVIRRKEVNIVFSHTTAACVPEEIQWDSTNRLPVIVKSLSSKASTTDRDLILSTVDGHILSKSTFRTADCHQLLLDDLLLAIRIGTGPTRFSTKSTQKSTRARFYLEAPSNGAHCCFRLQVEILWRAARSFFDVNPSVAKPDREVLVAVFPDLQHVAKEHVTPQQFYDCLHVPENAEAALPSASELCTRLFPFQQRAVRWLLSREGVDIGENGALLPRTLPARDALLAFFAHTLDQDGQDCFFSHFYGVIAKDLRGFLPEAQSFSGGILAEEMGLGKTLEVIALICLHKRGAISRTATQADNPESNLPQLKGTLIIAPALIARQWMIELEQHAPGLRVFHYLGVRAGHAGLSTDELVGTLMTYDVVVTSYNVVASEYYYAQANTDRKLRHDKKYAPRRSPLVSCCWWRVCLDEAQMIEGGVSNAAEMAWSIPRCNSWAVTGTPIQKDVQDLTGMLKFLHCLPFCNSSKLSRSLASYPANFRDLFSQITLRHSKQKVAAEIRIPPQRRYLISLPFTRIEEQHYSQLFHTMCEECGVDREGAPLHEGWDPASPLVLERMRSWLVRLRQTCLHPDVGIRNRKALRRADGQPIRTAGEVLGVMVEQNDALIRAETRNLLLSKIRRGQVMENDRESRAALDIWLDALSGVQVMVNESRAQLEQEEATLQARSNANKLGTDGSTIAADANSNATGFATENEGTHSDYDALVPYKLRLRAALQLEHMCTFFAANAYYQLKRQGGSFSSGPERLEELAMAETTFYEKARKIRAELLSEVHARVLNLMNKLERGNKDRSYDNVPEIPKIRHSGAKESQIICERLNMLAQSLNQQASLLEHWRQCMEHLLLKPLVDEEEGIDVHGDEFERSAAEQDEMLTYMEILPTMILDRHDAITGQTSYHIAHNIKRLERLVQEDTGHNPGLMRSLLAAREQVTPTVNLGSIRSVLSDMRSVVISLQRQADGGSTRATVELALAQATLARVQDISVEQTKAVKALERELKIYQEAQNARIEYYRQLQEISDTVAPYNGDPDLALMSAHEKNIEDKIKELKTKARYLENLSNEPDAESQRMCLICQQDLDIGYLTICGHQYCKECITMWFSGHKSCPACKKPLKAEDMHKFIHRSQEMMIQEEVGSSKQWSSMDTQSSSIYSALRSSTLHEIKNIALDGSYSSKIDMICRHVLWIRAHEPGTKSIVFSQFQDFLAVLQVAFAKFKICYVKVENSWGTDKTKYKNDPAIEVFLLHAKTKSSGLNLVEATHVFLCEPFLNTAIELQAIARVHRIGQLRPTTVWMYIVKGTVEEAIYELSVARRLEHIKTGETVSLDERQEEGEEEGSGPDAIEAGLDAANSRELQESSLGKLFDQGRERGEMVDPKDLWSCLFGRRGKTKGKEDVVLDPDVDME